MRPAEELVTVVRARTADTPYVVRRTADGFDVGLDVDDPRWFTQLRGERLAATSTYHVRAVESERQLVITEERRALHWSRDADGEDRLTLAPVEGTGGPEQGTTHPTRGAAEGLELVVDAASVLGWTVRRSLRETLVPSWVRRRRGRASRLARPVPSV